MLDRNSCYLERKGMSCAKVVNDIPLFLNEHYELISEVNEAINTTWLKGLQSSFWETPNSFLAMLVRHLIVKA